MSNSGFICEYCDVPATQTGTVRNYLTCLDEIVLVCDDHTSKCHHGTVQSISRKAQR